MVGSTSQDIADHIKASWANGQEAVAMLREVLGSLADVHVPVINGGVMLHKLQGVMHDTCHTANKTARLALELRNASGQLHFGYDEWESLCQEDKPWFDYLCANHARNLPMDELSRLFQDYINKELGDSIKAIQAATGGRSRVEASGILFLRSLCRLTHTGHAQYAKGDGTAFADYVKRTYPNLKSRCVGRAENSKRQDWSCEASWNLFNLLGPILQYTIETLQQGENVLRDSVLTRIQDQRFEAYVHANAILWKVVFHELRALTNTTKISDAGLGVNPMEINDLMDHLWNVAVLLQGDNALEVLDDEYRPWPKVRVGEAASQRFYAKLERSREADLDELRRYETRGDVVTYREKLLTILKLAGQAIHKSLQYTMGKYLKATDGIYRNEIRTDWEIEAVANLLSTNNAAERPFGIAKAYCDIYPSMNLRTLASFSLSAANGSHRAAETMGKQKRTAHGVLFAGGAALKSAPEVQAAVTMLCGVRRIKKGKVTVFLDTIHATKVLEAADKREQKQLDGIEEQKRKDAKKGVKFNTAMEETLALNPEALEAHLQMLGHAKGVCILYLQNQYKARKVRAELDEYNWPTLGPQFRSRHTKKLKMTPNDKTDALVYLKGVVLKMMDADAKRTRPQNDDAPVMSGLLRTVPTLSHESINPLAVAAKQALDNTITAAATQSDDPWLLFLEEQYLKKLCFLYDISARHKLYRVASVSYWPSTKERFANWEATLEPVHLDDKGEPYVADDDVVLGPSGKTHRIPITNPYTT
jgi:hypothetical protein